MNKTLVVIIDRNLLEEAYLFDDYESAEKKFLELCEEYITTWNEYTSADVNDCLTAGFALTRRRSICITQDLDWRGN
jgi:hypothetical protein